MGDPNLRGRRSGASTLRIGVFAAIAVLMAGAGAATRVATKTVTTVKPIPAKVVYEFSRQVGPGRIIKGRAGVDGQIRKTYKLTEEHGKIVSKVLLNTEVKRPVDAVMLMGRAGFEPNRSSFSRSIVKTMIATGYDASPATIGRHATGRTCTGRKAIFGCIAVDPRVIPFGTLMYVEGYGFGLACDRGSAIKGNRIDLCFNSKRQSDGYGRKPVRVHILKPR